VFFAVSWPSCTEHYGSVGYRECSVLYHGPLVQNIMVVFVMTCIIAVTTPGDVGREKDVTHLKIREQAEHVKEELAGVAGSLTFTLTLTLYDAIHAFLSHLVVDSGTVLLLK